MNALRAFSAGLILAGFAAGAIAEDVKKPPTAAQAATAASLDQLLEQTRTAREREAAQNASREAKFIAERNQQAAMLGQARGEKAAQEARATSLGKQFDENEKKLTELQAVLDAKGGNLGELFGTVRQVAGDVQSVVYNSMITARYPDRDAFISDLAQSKALPSIDQLEKLWFEMQREATESGKSARFKTKVISPDGKPEDSEVVMIGPFTAEADGKFLNYLPSEHALAEQAKQPGEFLGSADDMDDETKGYVDATIDPMRGVVLQLYQQRPNIWQRIKGGKEVGAIIILVGLITGIAAFRQFLFLRATRKAVELQLRALDRPMNDNPLGRVLASFKGDSKSVEENAEVVELRISEAVMREVPPLERYQSLIRLAVAAGPLLGLIGTVAGMILTFQAITESGSGDPRLMAAGISQAMIATVLGLGIAVPLLFVNALLQSMSRHIVQILDEQSTGLLAERLEKKGRA